MTTGVKKVLAAVTSAALAFSPVCEALAQTAGQASTPAAPASAAQSGDRQEYAACQATDPDQFRAAIEEISWKALSSGIAKVDYEAVVREEWRKGDLDKIIDTRVDAATNEIREESSWATLLQSLASSEQAKRLATAVAERTYRSEPVKEAIVGLATGVGEQIGEAIVVSAVDASGPAQRCVQLFLGERYGRSVAQSVSRDAGSAFTIEAEEGRANLSTRSVLLETSGGLTGAAILLVRRQLSLMASRLGQRVVGTILSRLVSVVAGGVGLALIAKDIWDFRYGMLPIIAEEMKSAETKERVREELASSIKTQIDEQARTIARETSQRILDIWLDFKRAHVKVLELAEESPEFRDFLDVVGNENLQKLDEIVSLILPAGGKNAVLDALRSGKLQRAVLRMPKEGLVIAREMGSVDKALVWSDLAGGRMSDVVESGLHRIAEPEQFTTASLNRLLNLDDRLTIQRLAAVPGEMRTALFELPDAQLTTLSRSLTEDELTTLARYIGALSQPARQDVLQQVAEEPAQMQKLSSQPVRDAVLASRDQQYAVRMLLHDTSLFDIDRIWADLQAATSGRISPWLIWERYPSAVVASAIFALLLLLMIRGLLFGGRTRKAGS